MKGSSRNNAYLVHVPFQISNENKQMKLFRNLYVSLHKMTKRKLSKRGRSVDGKDYMLLDIITTTTIIIMVVAACFTYNVLLLKALHGFCSLAQLYMGIRVIGGSSIQQ